MSLQRALRLVIPVLWPERWLVSIQLHVKRSEQGRRPGVVAHQRDEIDECAVAEVPQCTCERLRRHLSRTKDLATHFDNNCVGLVEAARIEAMLDDCDDVLGDAFAERLGLMRRPFELAVELTRGGENGQFPNTPS